jgi:hypothetical protein
MKRKTKMSLLSILGYGVGAIAVLAAGTMLLPRKVSVERNATFAADPAAIIAMAASNEGYQKFNPYKTTDANLKIELFGPATGVGAGFRFDGKEGKGSQVVTAVSGSSVSYDIDLGAMGKPKSSISVAPAGDKTTVTWRTDMDMGYNPIGRVMGLFMDGMIGGVYETGLQNIEAAVKTPA